MFALSFLLCYIVLGPRETSQSGLDESLERNLRHGYKPVYRENFCLEYYCTPSRENKSFISLFYCSFPTNSSVLCGAKWCQVVWSPCISSILGARLPTTTPNNGSGTSTRVLFPHPLCFHLDIHFPGKE